MEQHSYILYPLLAVVTIALLVWGVLSALATDEVHGPLKVEYKREILTILRREPGGVNVPALAKELKLSEKKTEKLVEEMVADGQIASETRKGRTHIRLRL